MKTILLFNNALTGGGGQHILTLADAMSRENIDVRIVIYEDKIDFKRPDNVPVHLLTDHQNRKKKIAEQLEKLISEVGTIDLIVSNSSPSNQILSLLKHPRSIHCVHSAETKSHKGLLAPLRHRWRRWKYCRLYSNKHLITVSEGLKSYILHDLGASPLSIRTIYNPFDFDAIKKAATEKNPQIPSESYIVHVGRFDVVSKRHDILFRAYKMADIPHKLVLVGDGRDRLLIEEWIREFGLEKRVILAGFQSNPYPWIAHAELLVSSSDFEGFGRTLVEALALGIPVVSTDAPYGPSEILTREFKDFLSPTGDCETLAKNIDFALKSYPNISSDILNEFKTENILNEYLKLVHEKDGKYQ